jgi:hypothetical protein
MRLGERPLEVEVAAFERMNRDLGRVVSVEMQPQPAFDDGIQVRVICVREVRCTFPI